MTETKINSQIQTRSAITHPTDTESTFSSPSKSGPSKYFSDVRSGLDADDTNTVPSVGFEAAVAHNGQNGTLNGLTHNDVGAIGKDKNALTHIGGWANQIPPMETMPQRLDGDMELASFHLPSHATATAPHLTPPLSQTMPGKRRFLHYAVVAPSAIVVASVPGLAVEITKHDVTAGFIAFGAMRRRVC